MRYFPDLGYWRPAHPLVDERLHLAFMRRREVGRPLTYVLLHALGAPLAAGERVHRVGEPCQYLHPCPPT